MKQSLFTLTLLIVILWKSGLLRIYELFTDIMFNQIQSNSLSRNENFQYFILILTKVWLKSDESCLSNNWDRIQTTKPLSNSQFIAKLKRWIFWKWITFTAKNGTLHLCFLQLRKRISEPWQCWLNLMQISIKLTGNLVNLLYMQLVKEGK